MTGSRAHVRIECGDSPVRTRSSGSPRSRAGTWSALRGGWPTSRKIMRTTAAPSTPEGTSRPDWLVSASKPAWAACAVEPDEIDRINILRATHLAMAGALARLEVAAHHALVDGLPVKGLPCEHTAIVDGDAKCISIAAASIIAKVTRDRLMAELDRAHPGYGFGRHKGYSTPEHYEALRRLGPSPIHRRSFRPIAAYYASQGALPLGDEPAGA